MGVVLIGMHGGRTYCMVMLVESLTHKNAVLAAVLLWHASLMTFKVCS